MNPAAGCQNCELACTRQSVVFGEGPADAKVLILGEAPGAGEDIEARPFVGRSGQLLNRLLVEAGLSRREVYITNTVKCRPPLNRDPKPREIEACREWLEYEFTTIKPRVVVAVGRYASHLLFPPEKRVPIGIARATSIFGVPVVGLVTYHPAYALRQGPRIEGIIREDFRRVKRLLTGLEVPQ